MLQRTVRVLAIVFLTAFINGCDKLGDAVVSPQASNNLIANSSFESNSNFSLQDWNIVLSAGSIDSARDAAPGGGTWSVMIHDVGGFPPVGHIRFTAPAPMGTHVYRFSLWAKYFRDAGSASLSLKRPDTLYDLRSIRFSDTLWTLYGSIDTVTTSAGDSIRVTLGGGLGIVGAKTFYDLCNLEVLN